jgi:hypothetical protein
MVGDITYSNENCFHMYQGRTDGAHIPELAKQLQGSLALKIATSARINGYKRVHFTWDCLMFSGLVTGRELFEYPEAARNLFKSLQAPKYSFRLFGKPREKPTPVQLLEIGPGFGQFLPAIAPLLPEGSQITAVDIAPYEDMQQLVNRALQDDAFAAVPEVAKAVRDASKRLAWYTHAPATLLRMPFDAYVAQELAAQGFSFTHIIDHSALHLYEKPTDAAYAKLFLPIMAQEGSMLLNECSR